MNLSKLQILSYQIELLITHIDSMQEELGSKKVNEAYGFLVDFINDAEKKDASRSSDRD